MPKARTVELISELEITLGDKKITVPALLDTGAQGIFITIRMLRDLGVSPRELRRATRFYGVKGGQTTFPVMLDRVKFKGIPGCEMGPVPARAQMKILEDIALVGIDFIRAMRMKLLFSKTRGQFQAAALCRKPGPVWDRQLLRPVLKAVEFGNFDKRVKAVALLDTGAGETVLPVEMARELGLNVRTLSIKGKAVATYFTIMWAMLHSARILGTQCEAGPMPVIITPHASGPIVGARFFSQAGLVFDFDKGGEVRCK